MPTPAQNAATAKYIKNHMRRWVLQVHREYDSDIVEFLEAQDNVNKYLKGLVRDDMRKRGVAVNEQRAAE